MKSLNVNKFEIEININWTLSFLTEVFIREYRYGKYDKNKCLNDKTLYKIFNNYLAQCNFCYCYCEEHSQNTDSHFNLRPVTSDIKNNK